MKKNGDRSNPYSLVGVCTDTSRPNCDGKYGAISWYRIINPLEKLGGNIIENMTIHMTPQWALDFAKKGKIWFMKMTDSDGIDFFVDVARNFTGSKYVLDLDDDPFSIDKAHPEYKLIKTKFTQWKKMIKMADHIVVSTDEIKKRVESINPYITVIPNSIDPKIWEVEKKIYNDDKVRIGWIGSASHFADMPVVSDVFHHILKKYPNVELHLAGMVVDTFDNGRVFHHTGTKGYDDFPSWFASLGLDICIAPLKHSTFNRCKSNIKWLESSMLKIPTVLSRIKPYLEVVDGVDGFLAEGHKEWIDKLSILIENKELRNSIGEKAKERILKEYVVDKYLPKYKDLFEKLLEKKNVSVITSITGKKDTLIEQPQYKGVEYLAFVDKEKSPTWVTLPVCDKFKRPVMNAKIHKILSHKYTDCPFIMWLDGNLELKQDPKEIVKLLADNDIAFFTHQGRDCVYEEADACISLGKGVVREIAEQTKYYAKNGVKQHCGLYEATGFIRRNNKHTNAFFDAWWSEVCRFSNRDQISLPTIDKSNVKIIEIPGTVINNKYFSYKLHKHNR